MLSVDKVWDFRNRKIVLAVSFIAIAVIAVVDWATYPYFSLGFLYLFPIIAAAGFLPRWMVALLGLSCAILSEVFSSLERSYLRLAFEALALAGCGLFVAELIRNRRLSADSQQRLKVLVETSPAAIVAVDEHGIIELANKAAADLMDPRSGNIIGSPIAAFLPELHHAIRWEEAPQFRASMQCRGHRSNGESFIADVWFSTYTEGSAHKLAAIITEASENTALSDDSPPEQDSLVLPHRETEVLRLLVQGLGNKEIATRMSISESSVKNTLQQLFARTGVRTRSQLVRVAMERYRDLL
jgi:two-component system, LuxR family, sensor kinase FixL